MNYDKYDMINIILSNINAISDIKILEDVLNLISRQQFQRDAVGDTYIVNLEDIQGWIISYDIPSLPIRSNPDTTWIKRNKITLPIKMPAGIYKTVLVGKNHPGAPSGGMDLSFQKSPSSDPNEEDNISLGSGAFGHVYLREDRRKNRFAVKVAIDPLNDEAYILASLDHPNIVRFEELIVLQKCDICTLDKFPGFLVMEEVKGHVLDIGSMIRSNPWSVKKLKYMFNQLIHAVSYMHEAGVAHNDLFPYELFESGAQWPNMDNLLITSKLFNLTIIDFGLAITKDNPKFTKVVKNEVWGCNVLVGMMGNLPIPQSRRSQDFLNLIELVGKSHNIPLQEIIRQPWLGWQIAG